MERQHIRHVIGMILMATACLTALRLGGNTERRAAGVIALCWTGADLGQLITGLDIEPVIAADILSGLSLMVLAWIEGAGWLWIMVVVEAALLLIHALFYRPGQSASATELILNAALSCIILLVLVTAAIASRSLAAKPEVAEPIIGS
jgi:hypothetical protein